MTGSGEISGWARSPGWMKALLIVSLALNVGVAGLVGGTVMRGEPSSPFTGKEANEPGFDRRQSRILRMVPEARREEAKVVLLARADEYAAAQAALKKAQMDFVEALRGDPYQPERVAAALAARREASGTIWHLGYEQIAEIAAKLTPAERGILADRLEERTRRWLESQSKTGK